MTAELRAEFHLGSPSLPLVDLATTIPDTRLRLDEVLRTDVDRAVLLCWIETADDEAVERALDADASIADWTVLEVSERRRLYRFRMDESVDVQVAIEASYVDRGVTPIDATILPDGWLVRARFPDRQTLVAYRDDCERRDRPFRLEALYEPTLDRPDVDAATADLTPKQCEALVLAYESGYYDLPRGTTLEALSDRLGISRRSVSDRLRRAERAVIGAALANERLAHRDRSGS